MLTVLLGCEPSVGPCDMDTARQVVFQHSDLAPSDGLPMYAGQALVDRSCGGGAFCHAETAVNRFGAPGSISFDTRSACDNLEPEQRCDPERLGQARSDLLEHAGGILKSLENGSMPPGAAGQDVIDLSREYRLAPERDSQRLPDIGSEEGIEIVRNWLACGAPVVERAQAETEDLQAGRPCDAAELLAGDCRVRAGDGIQTPDPTWSSIYTHLIVPACAGCHQSGHPAAAQSQLDLDVGRVIAHQSLFRIRAQGNGPSADDPNRTCADLDLLRVDTQDSAQSLLLQKLMDDPPCGEPMPHGFRVRQDVLDAVARWIDCGAPLDDEECNDR